MFVAFHFAPSLEAVDLRDLDHSIGVLARCVELIRPIELVLADDLDDRGRVF
jgi:hypothetical protein